MNDRLAGPSPTASRMRLTSIDTRPMPPISPAIDPITRHEILATMGISQAR